MEIVGVKWEGGCGVAQQVKRSMLRPTVIQIGRWQPSLILFDTSRSSTALAEDPQIGKPVLLTYIKPNALQDKSTNRVFRKNAERLTQGEKRIRFVNINRTPLLIQPFQDQTSLNALFQRCEKSGKKIPGRVLCRIFYSIASKTLYLLHKKARFEFHPESITLDQHSRIGIYFALPDRSYKLFPYQIPNLLVTFFSPFSGLLHNKTDALQTYLSYPTVEHLKRLRSEAASRIEVERWLRLPVQNADDDDPELELQQVQRMSARPEQTTARLTGERWKPPVPLPKPYPQQTQKQIRGIYFLFAVAAIFIIIAGAWNIGTNPAKLSDEKPRSSPPVLIHAPMALRSRTGTTVATVLIHVDEKGSVISHKFQRGTPDQIARYNDSIRMMKFQSSYSNGRAKSAWLILELPLKN
jgi:hypothetical protein